MPDVDLARRVGGDRVGVLCLGLFRRWLVRECRVIIIVKLIQLALVDDAVRLALDIRGVDDRELFWSWDVVEADDSATTWSN